ncbi:hypothetical protein [Pseudomonas indica]|uniref:Nitrate and nitrite sensing n=1 Tax=Pseudomonas indica TaxID=137658 RepID=A0A1G9HJL1_9PSED|nr:hypothetical protein [Pseudomonas indica]MBU3054607.1 hypothetical protein [Pseudomonas indica]PAU62037.1 hypothetical protein BZL42_06705 [Pseudomonas indica]SDL12683.1 hypothetical protein SAMN05216186_11551 [Pseudomonas indica]
MEIWLAAGLGGLLLVLGQWLCRLATQRHHSTLDQLDNQALQLALELLQNLQKHRGLGSQNDDIGRRQREAIAAQLDELWQRWPAEALDLPEIADAWPRLRVKPQDFNAHNQLIECLLGAIHLLELRLGERNGQITAGLGEACRSLEDLARLRGLAVRAANHSRCPLELQIQMRYLCQRLAGPSCESRIRDIVARLDSELIAAPQVRLAPADCFALLTPIIDERLQGLRLSLA